MGYYYKFESKKLLLKKDTPLGVIEFIDNCVNNHILNINLPNHKLFTLDRWDNLFLSNYWLTNKTYFKKEGALWELFIAVEINYGKEEILEFAKWITPYVVGHKPKEFIGLIKGEHYGDYCNVYLLRQKSAIFKS